MGTEFVSSEIKGTVILIQAIKITVPLIVPLIGARLIPSAQHTASPANA